MPITNLIINDFRNLTYANIKPATGINLIHGENGSGKTSLLEAIYLLGSGKSFRATDNTSLIQNNKKQLSVFAEYVVDNCVNKIGIEKGINGSRQIQINSSKKAALSSLAYMLPIQAVTINSYKIFHDGPKARRQYLDKGLFHVNPMFPQLWRQYQSSLKQRNAALKQRKSIAEISSWDELLIESGMQIDDFRRSYILELEPLINRLSTALLPEHPAIRILYKKGWGEAYSMHEQLERNKERDLILGYTSQGPHKADLEITTANNALIKNRLSQGQLKLTAFALHLAQDELLRSETNKKHIILIDDITSELDVNSIERICTQVIHNGSQCFITCIDNTLLEEIMPGVNTSMFHMEHGVITPEKVLCG